ncbi:MAG: hypothetical protein ACR2QK_23555, partial [Acidimicrobiales bacterium]
FRAALGTEPLVVPQPGETTADTRWRLATEAATSHDAHVVKYILACLDAADDDPAATPLYHAAARRLLDIWAEAGGDPSDPLS